MVDPKPGSFYLGRFLNPADGKPSEEALVYDAKDLTTHGVIVGMTGSGKTGLGIVLLEEALLSGVPVLAIDPKGDLTNLLLNFPDFRPEDFQPWVNEADAERAGLSVAEFAAQQAATWQDGLASSGITAERMRTLKDGSRMTIYTPGSNSGMPVNIVGSLQRPALDFETESEAIRDEIESFVSSLLGLAGIAADPLASREHILLANLIENAWSQGQDLDLATLLGQVQQPPIRKLGLMDIDAVFPEKDRNALAMRLNGILAAPSFAPWMAGPPLNIGSMLSTSEGKPSCAIVYLAHLSDEQRAFVVPLLLGKLITWFRGQSGTTDLRALIYMDEVYGFVPPTANPPSKKPILTIFKQARAFGVGMVLATQNPVDLDYKAISNAGTWLIGRLQTEQDKARLMDGLQSVAGNVDIGNLGQQISGLGKRQFLLHKAGGNQPRLFTTRWAMSYLRGPLTKEQIAPLMRAAKQALAGVASHASTVDGATATAGVAAAAAAGVAPISATAAAALGGDETPVMPAIAGGYAAYHLSPQATWARSVGAAGSGKRLQAALLLRTHIHYDDTTAGIEERVAWSAVLHPLGKRADVTQLRAVALTDDDLLTQAPAGAVYVLPEVELDEVALFKDVEADLKGYLVRSRKLEVQRNKALKLFAEPSETPADFLARCQTAATELADAEKASQREKWAAKQDKLEEAVRSQQLKVDELERSASAKGQEMWLGTAGTMLGSLLGGRSGSSKLSGMLRGMSGFSGRKSRADQASARTQAAKETLAARQQELAGLHTQLDEALDAIDAKWADVAARIDTLTIAAEKTDVEVDELAVLWIPVG
jgi:hypothetical protein